MKRAITITVNGQEHEEMVENRLLLVDFLRDVINLTGTHVGCSFEGVCGACTVHLDGVPVKSCLMLAVQADGRSITTVEGLAKNGVLSILQQSFTEHHALQCGYCTSGILMNATEFLQSNPSPSEDEIRASLIGNICRCTGYVHIVAAIKTAAQRLAATRLEVAK
ncbi:(2Fe-2S)-binding protein [Bradyrhizobium cajani]|uniref:2Fe-2S iron-sulfur cluster binding domain-containing protein n=1 Tax=Bradyrhizobium cajani TaxID=1928661 RepID=A0A844TI63_9BRAD|nr:(2Fe-2S)-binding protein [Bradyrhizobium cajani]MCP3371821.1 (2Fe-2S)-binding protein [Bradyrhizobium cajani]MVT76359.1 2Fe-2S iron-sulfur cluster binding domain-containing protein [Bradyrhizobium cajani]